MEIKLKNIKVGNTLELHNIDKPLDIIYEEVTHVNNPDSDDSYFQIKTKNLSFDFLNFYSIIKVK